MKRQKQTYSIDIVGGVRSAAEEAIEVSSSTLLEPRIGNLPAVSEFTAAFTPTGDDAGLARISQFTIRHEGTLYTVRAATASITRGKSYVAYWDYSTPGSLIILEGSVPVYKSGIFIIAVLKAEGTPLQLEVKKSLFQNVIYSDLIEADAILARHIKAGEVTADKLTVDSLSAISADLGTITAGNISGANISGSNISNDSGMWSFSINRSGILVSPSEMDLGALEIPGNNIRMRASGSTNWGNFTVDEFGGFVFNGRSSIDSQGYFIEDSTHRFVTDTDIATWNSTAAKDRTTYASFLFDAEGQLSYSANAFAGSLYTSGNQIGLANKSNQSLGLITVPYATSAGNADTLDTYHAGNASGYIPLSNGTLNTNLNAELWGGNKFSDYLNQAVKSTSNVNFNMVQLADYLLLHGHIYSYANINLRNKADTGWIGFASRNTSGTEAVYDLANVGNIGASGNAEISGYIATYGTLYAGNRINLRNKANNGWLYFAVQNTAGTEAVYDLSNIGSISANFATLGTAATDGGLTAWGSGATTSTKKRALSLQGYDSTGATALIVGNWVSSNNWGIGGLSGNYLRFGIVDGNSAFTADANIQAGAGKFSGDLTVSGTIYAKGANNYWDDAVLDVAGGAGTIYAKYLKDSSGNNNVTLTGGKVGFGTASPSRNFHFHKTISGTTEVALFEDGTTGTLFQANTTSFSFIGHNGTAYNHLDIRTKSGEGSQLFLHTNGCVGIGTPSPINALDVVGVICSQATGGTNFIAKAGSGNANQISYNLYRTGTSYDVDSYIYVPVNSTDLRFWVGGDNRLTIDKDGRIGVGLIAPAGETTNDAIVHIHKAAANSAELKLTNTTTGAGALNGFMIQLGGAGDAYIWSYQNKSMQFATNNTERLRINGDGSFKFLGDIYQLGNYALYNNFTGGILGQGWWLDYNRLIANESYLEVDNLMVRNTLRTNIFQKDVVKVVNGYMYLSDSGLISSIDTANSRVGFDNSKSATFTSGTKLRAKDVPPGSTTGLPVECKFTIGTVYSNTGGQTIYNVTPDAGNVLTDLFIGETASRTNAGTILFDASSATSPFIDVLYDGVVKTRLGNISGWTSPTYGQYQGYGLASENVYLSGNANVVGTITAGDVNGWGSTFYAGRIRKNLILYSNRFDQWAYVTLATLDNAVTSPDGTVGTYKLTTTNTNDYYYQTASSLGTLTGRTFTFSVWLKGTAGETIDIQVRSSPTNVGSVIKTVTFTGSWQREIVTSTIPSTTDTAIQCMIRKYTGRTAVNYWAFGGQFEESAVATPYQPTDGYSVMSGFGMWAINGGFGGTIQNPVVALDSAGIYVRDSKTTKNVLGNGTYIGNWTSTTGFKGTILNEKGLYGYQSNTLVMKVDDSGALLGSWIIEGTQLKSSSGTDNTMYLRGGASPEFLLYKDANNYIDIFYSSNWWGINGKYNGASVFQLGATNQIAGVLFNGSSLYSSSYASDNTKGFYIGANGQAVFNEVTVRGTVYASNGTFTGTISGSTITGGVFQTNTANQRITINEGNSNQIKFYNSTNNIPAILEGFYYTDTQQSIVKTNSSIWLETAIGETYRELSTSYYNGESLNLMSRFAPDKMVVFQTGGQTIPGSCSGIVTALKIGFYKNVTGAGNDYNVPNAYFYIDNTTTLGVLKLHHTLDVETSIKQNGVAVSLSNHDHNGVYLHFVGRVGDVSEVLSPQNLDVCIVNDNTFYMYVTGVGWKPM